MPVQMIELEEVQMVEVSDDAMETTAEGSKWSGFASTGC